MTKRPNQPHGAHFAGGAPLGSSRTPVSSRFNVISALIALLVLASLLAGCTRDRPVVEETAAVAGAGTVAMSDTANAAPTPAPAAAQGQGEPEVQISDTATTTVGEGTPAPGATTDVEYEVKSGDTLASIALNYDVEVSVLRGRNNLATDLIQIGQILTVPVKPAAPTPTPEPFTYEVVSGDSLTGIAARFGVDWSDIATENKMADGNALRAGMKLIIPGYSPAASVEADGTQGAAAGAPVANGGDQATHTVKAGQTLTQIALMYDIPLRELQSANKIANSSLVKTGQVLVLPGMTVQQAQNALSTTHTVEAGESLSGIAKQYNIPMSEIMRANNMTNANLIKPGQKLIIPPPSN